MLLHALAANAQSSIRIIAMKVAALQLHRHKSVVAFIELRARVRVQLECLWNTAARSRQHFERLHQFQK